MANEMYYVSGDNGSVVQTSWGDFADTVSGDFRGPGKSADECLETLISQDVFPPAHPVYEPLFGDFTHEEMLAYVGA